MSRLTGKMPKAAFGKGNETVYDDSIRKALQLPANQFDIDAPQEKMDTIFNEIESTLGTKTKLVAER